MANSQFSLGEPSFDSTSALREYCNKGRLLVRPLASELRMASVELQAALSQIPSTSPSMMHADSRVRARIVAAHMKRAADGVDATVAGLVRSFLSFEKHYINVNPTKSKKHFDLNN